MTHLRTLPHLRDYAMLSWCILYAAYTIEYYHADFLLVIEILVLGKTNPNGIKYGKLHLSMKRRSLKSEQLEKAKMWNEHELQVKRRWRFDCL